MSEIPGWAMRAARAWYEDADDVTSEEERLFLISALATQFARAFEEMGLVEAATGYRRAVRPDSAIGAHKDLDMSLMVALERATQPEQGERDGE